MAPTRAAQGPLAPFSPGWCHQPGPKGRRFPPVGLLKRGLWSRLVVPTRTKGGISPGWSHEPGPMPLVYIQHLGKFDEHIASCHRRRQAAQIDAVRRPAAARCPDAVHVPPRRRPRLPLPPHASPPSAADPAGVRAAGFLRRFSSVLFSVKTPDWFYF